MNADKRRVFRETGSANFRTLCVSAVKISLVCFLAGPMLHSVCAQEKTPEKKTEEAALPEKPQRAEPQAPADAPHRFWDKRNLWLFAGVAAARALDYHSTGNMRRRGRDEILLTNEVVDNKPAFAAIQIGAVATSVGLSYLFHRTRHHRLERWVSILHFGVAAGGAVRNYCLDSHPVPP